MEGTDTIKIMSSRTSENDADKFSVQVYDILVELENCAAEIDWSHLAGTFHYIDARFDCSDFRFQSLMRIMYNHGDKIPEDVKIKRTMLVFKYWMDEPGDDSMRYWSENHQMLFAASEYLMRQMYQTRFHKQQNDRIAAHGKGEGAHTRLDGEAMDIRLRRDKLLYFLHIAKWRVFHKKG
jgi:hypothetical protein